MARDSNPRIGAPGEGSHDAIGPQGATEDSNCNLQQAGERLPGKLKGRQKPGSMGLGSGYVNPNDQLSSSGVSHAVCTLSKRALVVIPAKAGIQNSSEFLESGSR